MIKIFIILLMLSGNAYAADNYKMNPYTGRLDNAGPIGLSGSNGNIGIGSANPACLLDLGSGSVCVGGVAISGGGSGSGTVGIGTTGWTPYYVSDNTVLNATNNIQIVGANVGIGTSTAESKLTVSGTVAATALTGDGSGITNLPSQGTGGWTDGGTNVFTTTTTDNVGIGTTTPNATLLVQNAVSTIDSFRVNDSAADTTPFVISSTGNIGIGTHTTLAPFTFTSTAPTSNFIKMSTLSAPAMEIRADAASTVDLLNIQSSSLTTGNGIDLSSSAGSSFVTSLLQVVTSGAAYTGSTATFQQAGTGLGFRVNDVASDSTPFSIDSAGNVGIGTSNALAQLDLRNQSVDILHVASSSTDSTGAYMLINSGGNIGMGTISPMNKLQVNGKVQVDQANNIGWSVVAGANTACNTTCVSACVFGQDTAALTYAIVSCTDATADLCLCAGPT